MEPSFCPFSTLFVLERHVRHKVIQICWEFTPRVTLDGLAMVQILVLCKIGCFYLETCRNVLDLTTYLDELSQLRGNIKGITEKKTFPF